VRDLASGDARARLRAVRLLKESAIPEAAVPLARAITDAADEIQLDAIAAELNIFLADPLVPRRRIGGVVEVRKTVAAEPIFSAGPQIVAPRAVDREVLDALRAAARDDNPRVAIEALYAFGALSSEAAGAARRELLAASGPEIAALTGSAEREIRFAAARVMGRVLAPRRGDPPIDTTVGDALVTALNDSDPAVAAAAMHGLGAMRYERAVQALTDRFSYHGNGAAGDAALDALAHIAHAGSVPLFVQQLTSRRAERRVIAIEGLARSGDAAKLSDVAAAAAQDKNDAVALAARFASVLLAGEAIDPIADAIARARLREQARTYIVEAAAIRVAAFARAVGHPDARARLEVVDALGIGRDRAALPLVEPVVRDQDPQVASAAERAVARLRQ
jgi:HEAT repeat protein